MGKYRLDYFSKYYFYEEDKFSQEVEDGEFILEQIRKVIDLTIKGIHINILNLETYQRVIHKEM